MSDNFKNKKSEVLKVIYSEDQILKRVAEIGKTITDDYSGKEDDGIVFICVLKGAALFMADLIRNIKLDIEIDFIAASSYCHSNKSSGKINIEKNITCDINGKHVIIVEDIIDTGLTLKYICGYLKDKGALSIKVCAFLDKHISKNNIKVDYSCFDCPNEYIVGYGLDYAQKYRNLPFVSSLDCELND